jgi:hypothetical protein
VDASAIKSEKWHSLLEQDSTAVISIGSPLASLSSEVMLARMFGVEPFEPPHFTTKNPLPFYFVWFAKAARRFRSAFGLTWSDLTRDFQALAPKVKANRCSAFILNSTAYPVAADGQTWTMHGVIAAQRRASGSVWLVVSGLAGPATLAAARLVRHVRAELPISSHENSPVLWVPLKVKVKTGHPSSVVSGDVREIAEAELLGDPEPWPKTSGP